MKILVNFFNGGMNKIHITDNLILRIGRNCIMNRLGCINNSIEWRTSAKSEQQQKNREKAQNSKFVTSFQRSALGAPVDRFGWDLDLNLFFFLICPPELLPLLGLWNADMTCTIDAALLSSSRAGADLGRESGLV